MVSIVSPSTRVNVGGGRGFLQHHMVCDVCECVITKLCDECPYWLIYMHQLMHVNLLYQCLRLSCPCVCVAECHLWLEITHVRSSPGWPAQFGTWQFACREVQELFSKLPKDWLLKCSLNSNGYLGCIS